MRGVTAIHLLKTSSCGAYCAYGSGKSSVILGVFAYAAVTPSGDAVLASLALALLGSVVLTSAMFDVSALPSAFPSCRTTELHNAGNWEYRALRAKPVGRPCSKPATSTAFSRRSVASARACARARVRLAAG